MITRIIITRMVIWSGFERDNAFAVMEEFWQQGDEDRMLGKPVDLMYDRELAHEMPVGQIGNVISIQNRLNWLTPFEWLICRESFVTTSATDTTSERQNIITMIAL